MQSIPGAAGVINTGGQANTPDFSGFIGLALAADQKKKQETAQKKDDAQKRAATMLTFAQNYGIFPEPQELQKAIKEGWGFSPMDPATVGEFQGGSQPLGAKPNSVTGTGKALQNPGNVPNVTPTTPAGTGVVEKGSIGSLVAPPLSPNIDRDAIMNFARQRFGLAANIAGAQLEAGQRQKWEDSYAAHVADLHQQALDGDPKAIINYQLIANNGKLDPKLMEALPFITSPDKRQELFQTMHDAEDAGQKETRKANLAKTVIEHMGDRFDNPLDMQHFINDISENRPATGIRMAPGKEKFKDTLDSLTTMIGDPTAAGHIMDLWVNGVPLGTAIDATLPSNFLSLPRRKAMVEEANALSERMTAQASQARAQAEQLTAKTGAAKEVREGQAAAEKLKLGAMGSAIDLLTSPNATKLDPEFAKGLEQIVAPYLGLQKGNKRTWTSPLSGVDTFTPVANKGAADSGTGGEQASQPGPVTGDAVRQMLGPITAPIAGGMDAISGFAKLMGAAENPAEVQKLLNTPEGQSAMSEFVQFLQAMGGAGRGLMQAQQSGR